MLKSMAKIPNTCDFVFDNVCNEVILRVNEITAKLLFDLCLHNSVPKKQTFLLMK